jgi:N-acetylmuramoyl-L-alanine amidase
MSSDHGAGWHRAWLTVLVAIASIGLFACTSGAPTGVTGRTPSGTIQQRGAASQRAADQSRAGTPSTSGSSPSVPAVPKPRIVWRPIPFDTQRKAEMAAYAQRHYRIDSWRLVSPKVIVEHFTAGPSFSAAWSTFSSNVPDPGLGELPGVCSHFVIDTDGTIYQLVPLDVMCRHTVGLNYTAIGIEMVARSDQQILTNPDQLHAALDLTAWLMQTDGIELRNVIGHNESITSPYHHELYPQWRCQTHQDWNRADMDLFRADLRRILLRDGITPGPPATPVDSGCA